MHSTLQPEELGKLLSGHTLFRCADDPVETCTRVGQIFRPHRMRVLGAGKQLSACMEHLPFAGISLNRLSYGSSVSIASEPMEEFLMVFMPLSGVADITCGSQQVFSTADKPALVNATKPLEMRWTTDSDILILRIQQNHLEEACKELLGYDLDRPLEFDLAMDLHRKGLSAWQSLIAFLTTNRTFTEQAVRTPSISRNFENLLLTTLLQSHPHNYMDALERPDSLRSPLYVRRAEQYIYENCEADLSVQDIAHAVGVSVRTLYAGFQQYKQATPMHLLRDHRLERVREELKKARNNHEVATIAGVALSFGFTHLGHFSRVYREKFGELPSQTLKGNIG